MIPFCPEGVDEDRLQENSSNLEARRIEHLREMVGYLRSKGYTLHPNETQGRENDFGVEHPFRLKRIAFPKHIMTPDPNADIQGQNLVIRRDIPVFYILACLAHEATHLDRYFSNEKVRKMTDVAEEKVEKGVPITDAFEYFPYQTEQFETDVQAYFLLGKLGVEVEPANYCSYVGGGSLIQREVYEEILRRMGKQEKMI